MLSLLVLLSVGILLSGWLLTTFTDASLPYWDSTTSILSIAAMWLKLVSALPSDSSDDPFVEQQMALAKFFITYHLPSGSAARSRIESGADPVMNLSESGFAITTEVN